MSLIKRKEPETELEPEPQFIISAPAPGGKLILAPRPSATCSGSPTLVSMCVTAGVLPGYLVPVCSAQHCGNSGVSCLRSVKKKDKF
jgi:hypothetical protein